MGAGSLAYGCVTCHTLDTTNSMNYVLTNVNSVGFSRKQTYISQCRPVVMAVRAGGAGGGRPP